MTTTNTLNTPGPMQPGKGDLITVARVPSEYRTIKSRKCEFTCFFLGRPLAKCGSRMKTIKLGREYWNSDNLLFPPQQCTFQRGNFSTWVAFMNFCMFTFLHFYNSTFSHISLHGWLPYQNQNWRKVELLAKRGIARSNSTGDPDPSGGN